MAKRKRKFSKRLDVVYVDGQTGEVYGEDYNLTVELERKLYFSEVQQRWLVPPVPGVTIYCRESFKED